MHAYLAVFLSNKNSAKWRAWRALSKDEQQARDDIGLPALRAWDETHRANILYMGGPLGRTRSWSEAGVADVVNELTAFVVVKAESHDAAVAMFEGHPHITIFPCDSVEVMPMLGPAAEAALRQAGGCPELVDRD
jgi:hypothetical protein